MKALIDTDAFCKLGGCGLLDVVVRALGAELTETKRLAALPHMLRKGALARRLGSLREPLQRLANGLDAAPEASATWLDRILAGANDLDPGEAQLLAVTADHPAVFLITGDKRAVLATGNVNGLPQAISGRVVTVEASLIAASGMIGINEVKWRVQPVLKLDTALRACFASTDSLEGLKNYQADLVNRAPAGLLWSP